MSQSHIYDSGNISFSSQTLNQNANLLENKVESVISKHCKSTKNLTESDNESKTLETESDIAIELSEYRAKNINKIVLATLNINSIRNKFSSLAEIVSKNINVLVIQETKLDATFPEGQFLIPGFKKPFRRDRDKHGGGY